ncbi:hypothetical protein [Sandaracinus amylolyticus]|uniref:hypothetical protein n=1 Tax=Sandaracinus amylolyticus TaxID=927083 RepID=UPI001F2BF8BF|nr:hypothetical protein [Sandaracinus amylolyticus]
MARTDQTPLGMPQGPTLTSGRTRDDVDPELLALPAPPSGRRIATLTLMAMVVVASIALATSLRFDLAYFFAPGQARDLGSVTEIDPATLETNTFVRVAGTPMASTTVRYQRIVTGESYVVFPLAGQRTVFVHMPESLARSGRTEYAGRLVTFGQLGARMRGVQGHLADEMGTPASAESFVVLVDESPPSYAWAVGLVLLCIAFVVIDLILVLRWFRPLPNAPA